MTVLSSPSVIYEGTTFTLTCSIELFEEVSGLVTLNMAWTGPGGATLTGTLSGSETSYISTSMADTPGNYTCSARLVSNYKHLSSSLETKNVVMILTGTLESTFGLIFLFLMLCYQVNVLMPLFHILNS